MEIEDTDRRRNGDWGEYIERDGRKVNFITTIPFCLS